MAETVVLADLEAPTDPAETVPPGPETAGGRNVPFANGAVAVAEAPPEVQVHEVDAAPDEVIAPQRDATPRQQIGVRLTEHHLLIADAIALDEDVLSSVVLVEILEAGLNELQPEAHRLAEAIKAGVNDPKQALVKYKPGPVAAGKRKQVSIRISKDCYLIARTLAVGTSVPRVCEPILEAGLRKRQQEAARAALKLARRLRP